MNIKEANMKETKQEVKLISIDKTNIDDLFIYKHKIEENIASENNTDIQRMSIDNFINKYLRLSDNSFFCQKTQNTVAFSLQTINDEYICFHTVVDDITLNTFVDEISKVNWSIEKMSSKKPQDIFEDIDNTNFFIIGKDMRVVD